MAFLLTIKMAYKESSFEPPADLLATVKKATWNYDKEHHQRPHFSRGHAPLVPIFREVIYFLRRMLDGLCEKIRTLRKNRDCS